MVEVRPCSHSVLLTTVFFALRTSLFVLCILSAPLLASGLPAAHRCLFPRRVVLLAIFQEPAAIDAAHEDFARRDGFDGADGKVFVFGPFRLAGKAAQILDDQRI